MGLCLVAYDKQKKCTTVCSCWVQGQQGHCTHKYAVQEYVGEKKWTADQPLPAARVATAEYDTCLYLRHLSVENKKLRIDGTHTHEMRNILIRMNMETKNK